MEILPHWKQGLICHTYWIPWVVGNKPFAFFFSALRQSWVPNSPNPDTALCGLIPVYCGLCFVMISRLWSTSLRITPTWTSWSTAMERWMWPCMCRINRWPNSCWMQVRAENLMWGHFEWIVLKSHQGLLQTFWKWESRSHMGPCIHNY